MLLAIPGHGLPIHRAPVTSFPVRTRPCDESHDKQQQNKIYSNKKNLNFSATVTVLKKGSVQIACACSSAVLSGDVVITAGSQC